jgi:hypothetical protein
MNKTDLYKQAQALKIKGRSKMNKAELEAAILAANTPAPKEVKMKEPSRMEIAVLNDRLRASDLLEESKMNAAARVGLDSVYSIRKEYDESDWAIDEYDHVRKVDEMVEFLRPTDDPIRLDAEAEAHKEPFAQAWAKADMAEGFLDRMVLRSLGVFDESGQVDEKEVVRATRQRCNIDNRTPLLRERGERVREMQRLVRLYEDAKRDTEELGFGPKTRMAIVKPSAMKAVACVAKNMTDVMRLLGTTKMGSREVGGKKYPIVMKNDHGHSWSGLQAWKNETLICLEKMEGIAPGFSAYIKKKVSATGWDMKMMGTMLLVATMPFGHEHEAATLKIMTKDLGFDQIEDDDLVQKEYVFVRRFWTLGAEPSRKMRGVLERLDKAADVGIPLTYTTTEWNILRHEEKEANPDVQWGREVLELYYEQGVPPKG